jgi:hypothetical protein
VSINQLISSAVGEKMSALMTEEYLAARGKRGSRRRFMAALSDVPNSEPTDEDQLESPASKVLQRTGRRAARR